MDSMFILKIVSIMITTCACLIGITAYYGLKIYFLFKKNTKEMALIKQQELNLTKKLKEVS
ncbi:hypothetical protein CN397_24225 [Priestia megaterium]|uniref:hypothetical protein n=1 Tax=Priestia megaterium TaxID=1404 RepID=UPI000BF6B4B3|nr:hypothetical protein [Priestia megaterium]PEU68094.1 hypothetical protein CN397_24225 [Priestia megaterium]TJZ29809.1 hypothetical protein FA002_27985 [Priestia megaterium]